MKHGFKKLVTLLLAALMVISAYATPVEAASKKNGLKQTKFTGVTKTYSQVAEGVTVTFTWKKVKGAKGYQVSISQKEFGDWYNERKFTKKRSFSAGGSSISDIRIKVRPYKIVRGKKKFGPWSKVKKYKIF